MRYLFIVFFGTALLSCKKQEVTIPPEVLNEDKMVSILIDVHLLEAKVRRLYLQQDSSQAVYVHYENQLFEKHGVSRATYERSMEFYIDEIDMLSGVYDRVLDSLLARQKANRLE